MKNIDSLSLIKWAFFCNVYLYLSHSQNHMRGYHVISRYHKKHSMYILIWHNYVLYFMKTTQRMIFFSINHSPPQWILNLIDNDFWLAHFKTPTYLPQLKWFLGVHSAPTPYPRIALTRLLDFTLLLSKTFLIKKDVFEDWGRTDIHHSKSKVKTNADYMKIRNIILS